MFLPLFSGRSAKMVAAFSAAPEDIPTVMGMIQNVSAQVKTIPDLVKSLKTAYENLRNEEEVQMARGGIQILSSMDADEDID